MALTDQQVRLLMKTYERTGSIETAAAKADVCRQTGAKYVKGTASQSFERKGLRSWRTRLDPLEGIWETAESMLLDAPELEAKALFEWLCARYPTQLQEGQLRTFQRRISQWRAMHGPEQEVFFQQKVSPGRRISVDFTHMNELEITINGVPFPHMTCHSVLSYSNWEWATVCFSESIQALREGIQTALFRLGHVPEEIWTDNSTSATHNPSADDESGLRQFNSRYLDLTKHFGMSPHTINVGKCNENGSVESLNGHLKRRMKQHLLLRGSRDFSSRKKYELFLNKVLNNANDLRRKKLAEETDSMNALTASRLAEWTREDAVVRKWSVVVIGRNTYSVPSRLIGKRVSARVYEDHIEVYFGNELQLEAPRLRGRGNVRIDYRHIIRSLIRKPGAFREYRYREELFPTLNFRRTYDMLCEACIPRTADLEYLRILELAAKTMETTVDEILASLLIAGTTPRWTTVQEFMPETRPGVVPDIEIGKVELAAYDGLLEGGAA